MTNDTKQPSAVRSRDEQKGDLALCMDVSYPLDVAERHILKAEQRARIEQSREAAYWIDHRYGTGSPPFAVKSRESCAFPELAEPVYAAPQAEKVARLEAALRSIANLTPGRNHCSDFQWAQSLAEDTLTALASGQKESGE